MGRKKPQVKKGKPGSAKKRATSRRADPAPPPGPCVPNWGNLEPDFYENLLEWVDTVEID